MCIFTSNLALHQRYSPWVVFILSLFFSSAKINFLIFISFFYLYFISLYCSNVFLFLFLYSTKTQFTSFYFLNFLDNIRLTSSCSVLVKCVGNCILKLIIKSPLPPSVLGNPSFDTSTLEVGFNTWLQSMFNDLPSRCLFKIKELTRKEKLIHKNTKYKKNNTTNLR